MWGVYHTFTRTSFEASEETIQEIVFTTPDKERAFEYADVWNSYQEYQDEFGNKHTCGALSVSWIPDPVPVIIQRSPSEMAAWRERSIPMPVNWCG